MKWKDLPESRRVENRIGQTKTTPSLTLQEQLEDAEASKPQSNSSLAKQAGVDDIP